jgi:hypothetical protein
MTGSLASYDALCMAYARHLLAEAELDAQPTPTREKAATQAYVAMVGAACRVDPHALRSPSISQWVEKRVTTYRNNCDGGFEAIGQAQRWRAAIRGRAG